MSLLAFPRATRAQPYHWLSTHMLSHKHFAILILEQTVCLKIKLKLQKNSLGENMVAQHSAHLNFKSIVEAVFQT